jgi:cbb3-type cytochrome oxidase cytochrome c subunit
MASVNDSKPAPEGLERVPRGGAPVEVDEDSAPAAAGGAAAGSDADVPPPLLDGNLFDGVKKAVYDDPASPTTLYRVPFLNAAFSVSSLLLLLLTVVAIYQDYDREWKRVVFDYQDWEAKDYARQQSEERARIEVELQQAIQTGRQLDSALDRRALRKAEALASDLTNTATQLEIERKFLNSEIAKEKFVYEEARKHIIAEEGGETERAKQRLSKLEAEFHEKWTYRQERVSAAYEAKDAEAKEQQAVVAAMRKAIEENHAQVEALTRKLKLIETNLKAVEPSAVNTIRNLPLLDFFKPSPQIQKVVLSDLTENLNFMHVGRVDRCKSCHVNIDNPDPRFAKLEMPDAPHGGRVFRSHPRLDLYIGSSSPHPYQTFGCSICHYGDGHSLTFVTTAHTPRDQAQEKEWEEKYHWHKMHHQDYPMVPMPYISMTCAKCHDAESRIPSAGAYNLGRELVESYGCFGCHKIQGFESYRKVGPDLGAIASKTTADFLFKWIQEPAAFRPSTKMPRFFNLANSTGSIEVIGIDEKGNTGIAKVHDFARRNAIEALAISRYLHGTARAWQPARPPSALKGDAARGKALFRDANIGCLGCHSVEREGWTENHHAPDLGAIGSKVDRVWLENWIVDPKKYFPKTRMPRLRIELDAEGQPSPKGEQDLADLVEYLMSLRDPAFEQRGRPAMDAEDRAVLRDIAYDYYGRSMTRKEAVEKIFGAYGPAALDGAAAADLEKGDGALLGFVGENLIRRYGCFGCHEGIEGFKDAQPIGTELSTHGDKAVDRLDFGQWGHQPTGEYAMPHTRIGWFTEKIENTRIFDMIPVRREDASGKVLYEPGSQRMQKTPEELLKMPLFGFHDDPVKVHAAVTFLLSRLPDPIPLHRKFVVSGERKVIEDGRRLVRELNCQGCHRIGADVADAAVGIERKGAAGDFPRFSADDTTPELLDLNEIEKETWLAQDLKLGDLLIPKHTFLSKTFKFDGPREELLDDYSVVEIAELYWNSIKAPQHNRVLRVQGFGEGPMRKYFGTAPQNRAQAAPLLRLQGERTHGDWLFDFLLNVRPLRPWLTLRMPSFDISAAEASALVAMFKALSKTPYPHEVFPEFKLDPARARAGKEIFQAPAAGDTAPRLGCNSCHPAGSVLPSNPDPMNWGPDLSLARARLRPQWLRGWFLDPKSFMPGTNMPNFWFDFDVYGDPSRNPDDVKALIEARTPWNRYSQAVLQSGREDWKNEIENILQYLMHMSALNR